MEFDCICSGSLPSHHIVFFFLSVIIPARGDDTRVEFQLCNIGSCPFLIHISRLCVHYSNVDENHVRVRSGWIYTSARTCYLQVSKRFDNKLRGYS